MNKEALERIKGYCCEVTQGQWDELVKAADEVGVDVGAVSRLGMMKPDKFARHNAAADCLGVYSHKYNDQEIIPFPDFLAKLKGEEKWKPKAGEMVEVKDGSCWHKREFVTTRAWKHFCWNEEGNYIWGWDEIRPIRATITRTEAEALLNKRIID